MPGTDIYGQNISLALVSDSPNAQTLAGDLANGILRLAVLAFDSAAHRGATLVGDAAPVEGMVTYLRDGNALEFYNGSAHRPLQEALPSLPRGSIGYTRTTSGTSNLSSTALVSGSKFTFNCSTGRRYRLTATCSWVSTNTGLSAGMKIAMGYAIGPTLPSDGSSTFEIISMTSGAAALNISVPVAIQHEFNGPTTNQISVGVFATPTSGVGNKVTNESCTLAIHDIGPAQ